MAREKSKYTGKGGSPGLEMIDAQRLTRVALGEEIADLALTGGLVLNVYTGEILSGQVILVKGEHIAYVGPPDGQPAAARTLELAGRLVVPGFIEGHTHHDIFLTVPENVRRSLPRGVTTVVTECSQTALAAGAAGVREFLAQFRDQPQRYRATCPMIAFLCGGKAISKTEILELLGRPEIVGLGEIYWSYLLGPDGGETFSLIGEALARGKTVEGHSAGARRGRLAAFAAAGVDACHEPITAEEVRDRLRLGLWTMIREGSIRRELDAVLPALLPMNLDLSRALLVSDGVWPGDDGHLDAVVQKAIDLGLDPVRAIQMVTVNAAGHFHLDELGGIAPGKAADLVVLPDLRVIRPEMVICRGRLAAEDGRLLVEPAPVSFSPAMRRTISFPKVEPGFFRVPGEQGRVRVMEMVTAIVTRETICDLPVRDGEIRADASRDILKVACLDRHGDGGFTGFFRGFGLAGGAVAASWGFDLGNPVAIGALDTDLALAVNRLVELGGGLVLADDGRVVAELALPLFGAISDRSWIDTARELTILGGELKARGCRGDNPLLTLLTVSFTAIPALRVTAEGYRLVRENTQVGLPAD